MSLRIELNPFEIIVKAFENLYPDKEVVVAFSSGIYEEHGGCTIITYAKEGEDPHPPIIFIDCVSPMAAAIEMIEHQLAHVILGPALAEDVCSEFSHTEEFDEIFRSLRVEYLRILGEGMKHSKIFKPREIDYSTMN